jgi:predicted component of type VI protein secretion system
MKISELIEQLSAYPQNSEVYLWVNGERIAAHSVDDSFVAEQWFIEINGETA